MILQELKKAGDQELSNLVAEVCVLSEKLQQVEVLGVRLAGQLRRPCFLTFILMGEDNTSSSTGTGGQISYELNHVDRIAH